MVRGERLNSITHLLGAVLSIAGSASLIVHASRVGDLRKIVGFGVFGAALIALYAVSTLYHAWSGPAKKTLRRLDHAAIYLLIAGTYTPFALVTLRGPLGWALLVAIWALALFGIVRMLRDRSARNPSPWPYFAMAWLGLVVIVPLANRLGMEGTLWLAAGMALYSAGIVFYTHGARWAHAHWIWHVFVMAGSGAHFVTVRYFVT